MSNVMDLSNALAGAVASAARAVVAVHGRRRLPSTGVHWRAGLVVTAAHTVETERDVTLRTGDDRELIAQVAGRDPGLDLALLRVEAGGLPVAELGADADLRVGHLVLALGAGPRASAGIVSALGARDAIAVDLTLYPGFSGGPLVDVLGRVVGITTSGASRHLQSAIRAGAVSRLADQVAERGRIPRAYLGVGTQPVALPEALRTRVGREPRTALIVVNVRPDSPAAAAGMIIGDIVLSIDGHVIAEPEDLLAALRPERVGQAVTVQLVRGGQPLELRVTVGERPPRA
jgi:S1-C subfamily serine protease